MCGASLDHLVGEREQLVGNGQAERLGGLEVDYQLEPSQPFDRQIGRFGPLEDSSGIVTSSSIGLGEAVSVAHQAAVHHSLAVRVNRRNRSAANALSISASLPALTIWNWRPSFFAASSNS